MKRYEKTCAFPDIWIDEIPSHWETHKMKYLFNERSEKGHPDEPLLVASQNMGVVPKTIYGSRTVEAQKDLHLLKLVRIGDFVISLRSFQGGLEYAYYQGIVSPAYTILIPHEPMTASYFRYLAKSKLFIGLLTLCVTGIREGQNIDYGKLRDHLLPVPSRDEQDQIVRYLDWQVSKINRLIAAKRKQIELLNQTIAHNLERIICEGMHGEELVETGNPWISTAPKSWNKLRHKNILTEKKIVVGDTYSQYNPAYDFSDAMHDAFVETKLPEARALPKNQGKSDDTLRKGLKLKFYAERAYNLLMERDYGFINYDRYDQRVGKRYLIQHSAGSGKSNSIAWLAHQLTGLEDAQGNLLVDSIIVVTDRVILDKQIRDTIRQFAQVGKLVAWAESSGDLRKAIEDGRRIIITTIEKFPYVLPEISEDHKDRHFAIIIDEAHSSQNGKTAGKMNMTLSAIMADPDMDNEDKINAMCEGKKLLTNASYFAFTATPKNKTLETFGTLVVDAYGNPVFNEKGEVQHRPFHVYTMKQAIEEGFILDVLKYYTPIDSYYRLIKTVEDDPMFDKKKAQKKLRAFVESQAFTIAEKADMMVSHFHEQVIAKGKIGGQARAMIITSSIERCIDYYHAVNKCLANRRSPYKAIIAFSGEKQLDKDQPPVTSSGLNGFADAAIPKTFKKDPYRFLIVADMFQTGYDEPLLHTMYVDKMLYDIKAVQTLSRLNRACPKKYDTFVLDFFNDPNDIIESFSRYYKTTLLSGETDPNKLYDLIAEMETDQVYTNEQVEHLVDRYLDGADRDQLDPVLDACAALYKQLDTDRQIKFKSAAKGFVRTYGFLSTILPYGNPEWEKLSIFLNMLIPKLPSPQEDDFSQGILEAIDLDSYRIEKRETISLILPDEDAEVEPVPTSTAKGKQEPEMDLLSAILSNFNDMFGNINWNDADNVRRQILEIPGMVSRDEQYQNAMRNSDKQEARTESDRVLQKIIFSIMADNMELFKQFTDNPEFKKWLSDLVFNLTYNKEGKPYQSQR